MRDNKAFASLSSGLLARKGQARPAMRPQGFGQGVATEDLGWNDMGYDAPRPVAPRRPVGLSVGGHAPRPANAEVPEVVRQQEEITREFSGGKAGGAKPAPVRRTRRAAKAPSDVSQEQAAARKAAFTLRLDGERHLRLRLACAVENRSAQQLVTEALDRLLDDLPDVGRLAASLPDAVVAQASARQD